MAWTIEVTNSAAKKIKKLDKTTKIRIVSFLRKIEKVDNPRSQGKALRGKQGELWRYRIGDYRIICKIEDKKVTVLVLAFGHRKEVYKIKI
ncbi:MAG: type II toxin-antitoxin system RelE/ParE family toxin [Rickettsiella sp.]|nr:type II toxin-antitoxin system RelE/ParE family toxin [Rickettsiella sp.]